MSNNHRTVHDCKNTLFYLTFLSVKKINYTNKIFGGKRMPLFCPIFVTINTQLYKMVLIAKCDDTKSCNQLLSLFTETRKKI